MSDQPINQLPTGITARKYVQFTYTVILIAGAISLLLSLLLIFGMYIGGIGLIAALCGIGGVVLSVLGLTLYKDHFATLDKNHFAYICVVFLATYVVGAILGNVFASMLGGILSFILVGLQLILIYTGFNSWKHGRMISANTLQGEIQLASKRA